LDLGIAIADDRRRPSEASAPPGNRIGRWAHLLAVVWFVALAAAVTGPALSRGGSFGSFDLLSQFGVLAQHGVVLHNTQAGDQSDQIIPWSTLAWTQVHAGHLPLWNPYSALGMPLAFNWQTAAFSVPTLVGYLFPLRLAFTVGVLTTLVIAGTGVYVLGRVLGLRVLSALFAGTVFELSGPVLGWLGWPHSAVISWSGWLFATAVLVVRGHHRVRSIAGFALVIAAAVYAGQAEVLILMGLTLLVFLAVLMGMRAFRSRSDRAPVSTARSVLDLALGVVAGAALGAPLLLPGYQLITGSQRAVAGSDPGELVVGNPPLPAHNLSHLVLQGFDGLPVAGSHWFGYVGGYSETAAYVGVLAVALVVTGVAVRRRRPEVVALGVMTAVGLAAAFLPPLVWVLSHLPAIGTLIWQRALLPMAFGLAVLAGFGMDALLERDERRAAAQWLGGALAVLAGVVALLWLFGRGHLSDSDASIRSHAFVWPLVGLVVGAAAWGLLRYSSADGRGDGSRAAQFAVAAGLLLLAGETAFLVSAGTPLWTSAPQPFHSTPAAMALRHTVGSATVGFGAPLCFFPPGLGITPNAQVAYGVRELALYDPMIPATYFASWHALTGTSGGLPNDNAYCPVVKTVSQARLYGVGYVLEVAGTRGPPGSVLAARIGHEDVYRIPGSAVATFTPSAGTRRPGPGSTQVRVVHPDPATWSMNTDTTVPGTLQLRLTDVPGWNATVDGVPVPLRQAAGVMLRLDVPAGRHRVELHYWPRLFTLGIALAGLAALSLLVAGVVSWRAGRRRPHQGSAGRGSGTIDRSVRSGSESGWVGS
jgi:hypothetical protein